MTEEIRPKGKLESIIDEHGKKLFIAGIALVLVAGAWWYYSFQMVPKKERAANQELFMAERYFERDSVGPVLEGTSEFAGALDIAEAYGNTKAGKRAHYYIGRTYMKQGKFDEAISHLEQTDFDDEMMAPLTKRLIGDCYVELDELETAVDYYWDAAKMRDNNYSTPQCYKKAALVYEKLENWEKALKAYTILKNDYPESEWSKDIQKYIARAEAKINSAG